MSSLVDQISAAGLADRFLNDRQLAELLGGSDARRYGLVNRALKDGSLIRLKRGCYVLARRYRRDPVHPFAVAQNLVPGSYISFETALSFHGWIPEAVFVTASVSPGRKSQDFSTPGFGTFSYHPLAINDYRFMTSVDRVPLNGSIAFVARPLRALMDLVALRKVEWSGLEWLTIGMRIEEDALFGLRRTDFTALKPVYKHKAANVFLRALEGALMPSRRLHDVEVRA
ncbi:type IV toxin-antitoxin system AbiEi family antitoxin domain-containing protein [Agrobacterium salinitolerans]|jgi:hypothetical protein|uniref:type IV toxin-antitoxin system AbiEi family antitoxin domain-containing protein n=1 Tax=Agrobacterium salinitolerans TaxID=1183413 RepID=UPI000DD863B8|nr:hypothetical protein [Agrobacterium salinitolerans]NTA40109.1 hypothetical protein [Agrobacterium salinitolerans]